MDAWNQSALRALVVDDEPDGRFLLVALLRTLGCESEGCCDGEACLSIARHFRPHLILLDLAMPGQDGLQVAEALRNDRLTPPLLVALSGYGDAAIVERCRQAGFNHHELKPLRVDRLRELVVEARTIVSRDPARV